MTIFRQIHFVIITATFLIGGAVLSTASAATETSSPLEVMTFNIRTGKAKDGPNRWEVRKGRTAEVIKNHDPDLIGLQEALSFQIDDLAKELPGYQAVGTGRTDGKEGGELCAIMWKPSRLHLLRSDTFWLSNTPSVPNTADWGNKFVRICTWAYFKDLETGRYFYHFNTHFDHISQPSRVKSAELILKRTKQIKPEDPVIVTGDFNVGESNPVADIMRKGNFRDSFRVLYPDTKIEGTTTGFRPRRQEAKIDYIFVDPNWTVKSAAILDDKVDGFCPSDHLPVTATLTIK